MNLKTAYYHCWGCCHEWEGRAGQWDGVYRGVGLAMPECPRCGGSYMTWINYEKDFRR